MILSIQKKIERQMDKELDWIVGETCSILFARAQESGGVVKRGTIIDAVARVVGQCLLEREPGFADEIDVREFDGVARDAIYGMTEETFELNSSGVAEHVAEMCVAYWEMRKMGMRTTYATRRDPMSDYNPFGNEGGFCNPMKLKMLHGD
jgi:hypothetical protein